jgi:hypothetical protein
MNGQFFQELEKKYLLGLLARKKKEVIRMKAIQVQHKNNMKEKTVDCPYPYFNVDTNTQSASKVTVECESGPGPWCKTLCPHYKRHAFQQKKMVEMGTKASYEKSFDERIKKIAETGLAPHLQGGKAPAIRPMSEKARDEMLSELEIQSARKKRYLARTAQD